MDEDLTMPTVILNKETVQELLGKSISEEEMKNAITMLGTGLEGIDKEGIQVEIFPNRPDLLSEQGLARALSSFFSIRPGLKEYKALPSSYKVIVEKDLEKVRPCTACAVVKGLRLTDERIKEIIQIQEKLHITHCRNRKKAAIGIYPMEHIEFPITFTARDAKKIRFRPLDAAFEMSGEEILTDHPIAKEYGRLLSGMKMLPVFVDGKGKILSLPPLINSHETGRVTEDTKDVFIECSGFDYQFLSTLLNMIVTALADMGGVIYQTEITYKHGNWGHEKKAQKNVISPHLAPTEMSLDTDYINSILGLKLKKEEMKKALERMGFGVNAGKVLVPSYRADIMHQRDLAEDAAIGYGFERFKPSIPHVATIGKESAAERFADKIKVILVGLGALETKTFHIINAADQTEKMNGEEEVLMIRSSVSEEYNSLRQRMLPSLMKVLQSNTHNAYPQFLFDIGTVFSYDEKKETKIREEKKLVIVKAHEEVTFTDAKQILDALARALDIDYGLKHKSHPSFIEGRCGTITAAGKELGTVGEIHPQVLTHFGLELPAVAIEIDMTMLKEAVHK